MDKNVKIIILGFALMLLGGFLTVAGEVSKVDLPNILGMCTYGLYIGFIFIVLGLVIPPKD